MKLPVEYWEIWIEPDHRPNRWTSSDDALLRLFVTTAVVVRKELPRIKIGG